MTSNTGSHLIQQKIDSLTDDNRDEILQDVKGDVIQMLKQTIRPEFLNRIDEIVMFNPLSKQQIKEVVNMQFERVKKMLNKQYVDIKVTDNAVEWLAKRGYDPHYGARPVKRVIQKFIVNELSKSILANEINKEKPVTIDYDGDKIVFSNE
jgi:ATP-dependent Clp protease ATP-binding subunit ClpB